MSHIHRVTRLAAIDAIRDLTNELGFPPSVREIGERIGCKGIANVHRALDDLRDEGIVHWEDGRHRTIRLVREGPTERQIAKWSNAELTRVSETCAKIMAARLGVAA